MIRRVTGELASLADAAAAQAAVVLRNGRRALPKALSGRVRGKLARALDELAVIIGRTAQGRDPGPHPAGRAGSR